MDSINDALAAILRTVQTPGEFFAAGECALHVPLIEVEGIGPIALPLLLSGLRVCTVQAIGLAVLAALIGAGGLGAIMFQGLLGTALDLVLLGVLPVVALALGADALFRLAVAASRVPAP